MEFKTIQLDRNQQLRTGYILKTFDNWSLVFYFMPNGARYINIVQNTDYNKYTTVTQKQFLKKCNGDAELSAAGAAMFRMEVEILDEMVRVQELKSVWKRKPSYIIQNWKRKMQEAELLGASLETQVN